ncbi:hypothetical protein Tco_1169311 [Tanacetum coccineum]
MSILRRITLAACVYMTWQERNRKMFTAEKRSWKEILKEITDAIRFKLAGLKVKTLAQVEEMALYLHLLSVPPLSLRTGCLDIQSHGCEDVAATMIRFGICLEGNVVLMVNGE